MMEYGTYTSTDGIVLEYDIYRPQEKDASVPAFLPAVVFYFGGGWQRGDRRHFAPQAKILAENGYCVFCPDYRVFERQGVSPRECVDDAAAFWEHLRKNAAVLGIDPDRIALGGGSAGGHLALMAGLKTGVFPRAYVLYNPAINIGSEWFFHEVVNPNKDKYPSPPLGLSYENFDDIKPVKLLGSFFPPSIIIHGEEDALVDYREVQDFAVALEKLGAKPEFYLYAEQGHGFFRFERNEALFDETTTRVLDFLARCL